MSSAALTWREGATPGYKGCCRPNVAEANTFGAPSLNPHSLSTIIGFPFLLAELFLGDFHNCVTTFLTALVLTSTLSREHVLR